MEIPAPVPAAGSGPEGKQEQPEAKQVEEEKKGDSGSDMQLVHLKNGATVSLQANIS